MNSYKYSLMQAKEFLDSLNIDEHTNALWDVLHHASWHLAIDWVRWLDENKPLVQKLIAYNYISSCPKELQREIWKSIKALKQTDE